MVAELPAGSARLILSADDSDWCQVSLDLGELYPLGAESCPILVEKLLKSLRVEVSGPESGTIDGVEVTWVLSLSERHTTIYTAQRDDLRALYFQGADGSLIARLDLSEEQRLEWVSLLEAIKRT